MLFQGEEWGATNPFLYFVDFKQEPDLAKAVAEGRCNEFQSFGWQPDEIPDPNAEETFQKSKLPWDEVSGETHSEMLSWYKSVIKLRRRLSVLSNGHLELTNSRFNEEKNWLFVERGPVKILCNFSSVQVSIPYEIENACSILLDSSGCTRVECDSVIMSRESVVILGPDASRSRGSASLSTGSQLINACESGA
jgi:maltooligosyltrehalose trehalohydrolase